MLFSKVRVGLNGDSINAGSALVASDLFLGSGSCFALPPASMQSHAFSKLAGSSA
ncbi:hypothetical protein [Endozoicomonas sp. ISHI1]|uniref:hypothetical protein n=1 Tax=Endozoicomonas sp. ISHI1 TaxID=2825882 RepID=UPI0021487A37|nr:hypothetical protein [Endozoicomonas sp. ISHI1]